MICARREVTLGVVLESEKGAAHFRMVDEFTGGAATNDATGFHDITSVDN